MAFWERPPFHAKDFSLAYFAILPLLWAAFRFDQRGAITCALIISGFALWATLHSLGPFARGDQNQSLLLVQTFMGTVTLTGLVLAAVIFQRTQDQQALAKWEFIFNHAGWAVAAADPQTNRLEMVNPAFAQMHGYTVDEMIGLPLMDTFAPESRQEFLSHTELTHQRGHYVYESMHLRKDGSKFPVLTQVTALKDDKGRLLLRAATFQDITEQKKAEEALREAHGLLADKAKHLESLVETRTAELRELVEELEAFSYSMAHDMRAPLRGMQGFAQILATEYAPRLGAEGQEYLSRIISAADRLDRLIQDVLQYTKVVRGELRLEPVDLDVLVREIIQTYPNLSAPNVNIAIAGVLPTVVGNTAALTQVTSNLLGNAVKFVAPGVAPRIRIRAEELSANVVRLWIEDNGIGIDKAAQARIFQMFQQLNRSGLYEGTGIGLTIVRKAVERMGGRVGVESELGQGSKFWIELKRATTAAEPGRQPDPDQK